MNNQAVADLYAEYVLPVYKQAPVCLVKGKGSRVWDIEGKEYLDFFPGWAVSGLGHCHPDVVNALKHQMRKIMHVPNNFLIAKQAELAEEIIKNSFGGKVFFCNSGAEAIEAGIKFARRFGNDKGRYEIITMKNSFHGRTLGAMTATGQSRIHEGFGPVPEGFKYAEFNNLASVEKLITSQTAAILLEPIQGEGGVAVSTPEFMKGLRKLCDNNNILLMLDEIQTGMGRTGEMFAYKHFGIIPDVMLLAKSLGNGVPIGAMVVGQKVPKDVFSPGMHGSTYGGNPVVTAAGLAVFKAIKKGKLLSHVKEMGKLLEKKLEGLKKKYSFIEEIRGLGVMRALKLSIPGAPLVEEALSKGLIINCTQENVLRIVPAITVTKRLINEAVYILDEIFQGAEVGSVGA